MNAVEIEQAVSELAEAPFDPAEFPYAFLAAFGNKETTLKRLRTGNTNQSDLDGVLQRGNIGYYFYSGSYADDILEVLDPHQKTILHIPNVNSRESTKDKIKEVEHILIRLLNNSRAR